MTTTKENELEIDDFDDESQTFLLSKTDLGERLDKVVAKLLPDYSRSRIQQWIDDGFVTINGKKASKKYTVLGGETLIVTPQASDEELAFTPEAISFPIVYEDDSLLVINKPAPLVVHPAAGNWSGTLLNGLLHYIPALKNIPRAGIVHRLDKDTTGLMVVAKTLLAQTALIRQLQDRSVSRHYLALCWGETPLEKTIDANISRHPKERIKMAVSTAPYAKEAITQIKRIAIGKLNNQTVSLVHCQLKTGRTHQIRVHMQHLGFPLVGDTLYGKPHLAHIFPRQALHAYQLELIHPQTQKICRYNVPVPEDMATLFNLALISDYDKT